MSKNNNSKYSNWDYMNQLQDQVNTALKQPEGSNVGLILVAIFNFLLLLFFGWLIDTLLKTDFDFGYTCLFAVIVTGVETFCAIQERKNLK